MPILDTRLIPRGVPSSYGNYTWLRSMEDFLNSNYSVKTRSFGGLYVVSSIKNITTTSHELISRVSVVNVLQRMCTSNENFTPTFCIM